LTVLDAKNEVEAVTVRNIEQLQAGVRCYAIERKAAGLDAGGGCHAFQPMSLDELGTLLCWVSFGSVTRPQPLVISSGRFYAIGWHIDTGVGARAALSSHTAATSTTSTSSTTAASSTASACRGQRTPASAIRSATAFAGLPACRSGS
jgi:hypothetical protein